MQRNIFGIEVLNHGSRGLVHQFLSQAKAPVGTLHSLRGGGEVGPCQLLQLSAAHLSHTLSRSTHQ